MKELWESGTSGRIIANVIWAVSFVVALYLLYISYKMLMRRFSRGKVKKVTVKYATLYDLHPPYAKGEVQFGFELPEEMEITFHIVNRKDEIQAELKKGKLEKGIYPVLFNTNNLPDGEYYYQLISEVQKNSKKFFIVNKQKLSEQ